MECRPAGCHRGDYLVPDLQIKLDWYKDYGIEVVNSMKAYEDYVLPDGEKIRLTTKTFRFIGAWGKEKVEDLYIGQELTKDVFEKVLEYIEKLAFLDNIGEETISVGLFQIHNFETAPGIPSNKIPFFGLAEIIKIDLDFCKEVERRMKKFSDGIDKNHKTIFQLRIPWSINTSNVCTRCGAPNPPNDIDILIGFRSRFVFGIIPKEAKQCLT